MVRRLLARRRHPVNLTYNNIDLWAINVVKMTILLDK